MDRGRERDNVTDATKPMKKENGIIPLMRICHVRFGATASCKHGGVDICLCWETKAEAERNEKRNVFASEVTVLLPLVFVPSPPERWRCGVRNYYWRFLFTLRSVRFRLFLCAFSLFCPPFSFKGMIKQNLAAELLMQPRSWLGGKKLPDVKQC